MNKNAPPACFFCGQPKDAATVHGGAAQDMEPCARCRELMGRGVTLLGTSLVPVMENQPASVDGEAGEPRYLTGNAVTIPDHLVRRLFDYDDAERLVAARKGYVSDEIIRYLHVVLGQGARTE